MHSQPNREFDRASTRIFVWRQSLRVDARADAAVLYGKSEPLRGARFGTHRRRALAAQKGRWRESLPHTAPRLGSFVRLMRHNVPVERGRAMRRHPQDRLRVAAPRARHGVRLPGPDRAARRRLGPRPTSTTPTSPRATGRRASAACPARSYASAWR